MHLFEKDLVYKINGCIYEVYKELGSGFLEKVYERALMIELAEKSLKACSQVTVKVSYKGEKIGNYVADIIVENKVILEIKAQEVLHKSTEAQILNYLRATGIKVGLLVNFTYPKAWIKRFVL